jgi:hypothetical protein
VQYLRDDEEEVQESPLLEGCPDRRSAFSLTQQFILNVGMGDARAGGRRVRIEGDHAIGFRGAEGCKVQLDLETAEIDLFELDRVGLDG